MKVELPLWVFILTWAMLIANMIFDMIFIIGALKFKKRNLDKAEMNRENK